MVHHVLAPLPQNSLVNGQHAPQPGLAEVAGCPQTMYVCHCQGGVDPAHLHCAQRVARCGLGGWEEGEGGRREGGRKRGRDR